MAFTDSAPPGMPMMGGGGPPMLAPPVPVLEKRYDVKIKRCVKNGCMKLEGIAPEDFMCDPDATVLNEKTRFVGDKARMTRSAAKLKWKGKEDIIDVTPAYEWNSYRGDMEKQARDQSRAIFRNARVDKSTEEIEVFECFPLVDYDGDGIAERRKVCVAGLPGKRQILSNEEWGGDHPYCELVPQPMPHRRRGRSLFDDLADIQRVKTVLLRQGLDNTYLVTAPMLGADMNAIDNPTELTSPQVGQVVWTNRPPGDAVAPIGVPYIGDKVLQNLEYWDMVMEKRTGVSRSSMALDTDTLQYQTAEAVKATRSSSYTKVETMARNIAEYQYGLRVLFAKLLKLFVENQGSARYVRSGEQVRRIDPRGWDVDMKVNINIGLGAGSREQDLATLGGIAQKQELFIQASGDPTNPVLNIGHLLGTYRKMIETAGLKGPEQFFPDITQEQVMQIGQAMKANQPPPPEMMKLQAEMQMKGMELQAKQKQDENRAVLDQRQAEQKAQIEQIQSQADIAVTREKTQHEMMLEERRFELEREMKLLEHQAKMRELEANHAIKMREADVNLAMKQQDHMMSMEQAEVNEPEVLEARAVASKRTAGERKIRDEDAQKREQAHREESMRREQGHMDMMNNMAQAMQQLAASILAPTEVVRDPKTGRVVGQRKRVN